MSSSSTSKASKAPSKPHQLFKQVWKECEDGKTKAPSRSGKSKKCKASKAADKYAVTDAKDETVEVVDTTVYFEPPPPVYEFNIAETTFNGDVILVPSDATDEDGNCVEEADAAPAGNTVDVPIEYYAVVNGPDATIVLPSLDYIMADDVANSMFTCGKSRRSLVTAPLRQGGRALEGGVGCVAVNSSPTEKVDKDQTCPASVKVEADQSCHVVKGGLMLTVSDSSDKAAAESQAYGIINDGFASGKYADEISGLDSLIMKSMAPAAATSGLQSNNNMADTTAALSPVAAAMLSVGLIAFIAIALMALRHKRKRDRAYNEFYDDDHDLFAKDTSSTDGSSLGAYVVDGVNGDDILNDLALQHRNQVDVHHCNSATCQICNGRQTTFIETGDNDTISEMYPDQFEIENDRTKSFEYFSRPDASSPEFSNPANIRPRLYEVEDTVSL